MQVTCKNNGSEPLPTTQALHTYFRVSDITQVSVLGLEDSAYLDNLVGRAEKAATGAPITVSEEVDRVYTKTGAERCHAAGHQFPFTSGLIQPVKLSCCCSQGRFGSVGHLLAGGLIGFGTSLRVVASAYGCAGDSVVLRDAGMQREVVLQKSGFADVVVWNPWIDKAANTKDFGDDEYKVMVCLEAANAAVHMSGSSVQVPAGGSWTASQQIYVRPMQS